MKRGKTTLRQGKKVWLDPAEVAAARRRVDAVRLKEKGTAIGDLLRGYYSHARVTVRETTSGAPLVRIEFPDGVAYHCTVTKARGKP
jgi:hypothetical protein